MFVFLATTSVTEVSFHHGQNQPFDPIDGIQVTTAAQTPAEVAESTGRADSSVNKRPAQRTTDLFMTMNDSQNFM